MEEENKKEEISQESPQTPPKEEISSEKTEELIKELLEEEKEGLAQEIKSKKFDFKKILFLLSLFFLVSIFLGGIFVLSYLFKVNKRETALPTKGSMEEKKDTRENEVQNTTKEIPVKKELAFNPPPKTKSYPFKLEIPNFLFPLDEKTFLKVDIYLYFERAEDYKKAHAKVALLREFFLNEINSKKDPMFWKDTEKVKAFENYLIEAIKKGSFSFSPDKIELEGVLLKV